MPRTKTVVNAGEIYGRWEVLGEAPKRGVTPYLQVRCTCGSGVIKEVQKHALLGGKSKSCGCLQVLATKAKNTKHGLKGTQIYEIWRSMLRRCEEVSNKDYPRYGGRGITVCLEWHDIKNFYRDMGDPPFEGASLEREDNSQGYCAENCKWASAAEQSRNKRNNVWVTFSGVTLVLRDWINITGHNEKTISERVKAGIALETALKLPSPSCLNPEDRINSYTRSLNV